MHCMAFSVIRSSHSLVTPCEQTPIATLDLSGIDSLSVLRSHARTLHVYRHGEYHQVAKVIKEGLSKALVLYYPLAGRLKESDSNGGGQLQVECSGQGVWLVEAYANCTLDAVSYLDDTVAFHSIKHDDLLPSQFPGGEGLDQLLQLQVTEFECGGFVVGIKFSHSICDGLGSAQFLNAVGEMARGLRHPSITPVVWQRDFFKKSLPKQQLNLNTTTTTTATVPNYELKHAKIDIYTNQINNLKREIQESTGRSCSSFEVVAAALWICRTRAVMVSDYLKKDTQVKLVFFANCRHLLNPPLPKGFYGNCFFPITVTASCETLAHSSLADVVKMIQDAKAKLPNEFANYIKEGDQIEEDPFAPALSYATLFISEWGKLGFNRIDFGWGSADDVIPIQHSPVMPAAIVGTPPFPQKGIRLITWCVDEIHRQIFIDHMMKIMGK